MKDLTEVTIADLWGEVKEQFWEDVNTETLRRVRRLLKSYMEEELLKQLRAGRWWKVRTTNMLIERAF